MKSKITTSLVLPKLNRASNIADLDDIVVLLHISRGVFHYYRTFDAVFQLGDDLVQ